MARDTAHQLLNDYQRDFPLVAQPYAVIAHELGLTEAVVMSGLGELKEAGSVSRIGATLRPGAIGAATLAALNAPADQLEAVAGLVSAYDEVNHNYEREHDYNLWFVVTAASKAGVARVLADIEGRTGLAVLDLPMVRDYFIDLGFDIDGRDEDIAPCMPAAQPPPPDARDRDLLGVLEAGLPLVPEPYEEIGAACGMTGEAVIFRLRALQQACTIRRFGVIVRHHELGFQANAMTVWQVAEDQVDKVGARLGELPYVRLCYQRRPDPNWPYNLYAMVHGRDRDIVKSQVAEAAKHCGLEDVPQDVLFSTRRFKQRGAHYLGRTGRGEAAE